MDVVRVQRALVIMAKRPVAGAVKTRLTPFLTPQQAADLYEQMLVDTIERCGARADCTVIIGVDDSSSVPYFSTIAPECRQLEQDGETLGHRLDAVLSSCIEDGFDEAYAIGSDSPDLPAGHLTQAFELLGDADNDVVLGPTDDGGYYLIGWKRRWRQMVTEVVMSTPTVLADTLVQADLLTARVALAPGWYDVDSAQDIGRLCAADREAAPRARRFLDAL